MAQTMSVPSLKIFSGNSNRPLAEDICAGIGVPLGEATVTSFPDGESFVKINENIRGQDVFIVQSTCTPTNHHLMELLILIDAARRASAQRITAVIPFYGYARQDRKDQPRVPITAKLVANLLVAAGANRILTMDLHSQQIQGFFDIPVDNVYGSPVLLDDLERQNYENLIVVSPDIGGVVRARAIAKQMDVDLAIIDRRRPKDNVAEVMNIIGDVKGRTCVLVDDMVDTAGTLCHAAKALKEFGAEKVVAYCTHPVLSGPAIERLSNTELDELVVTDTIPLSEAARATGTIRQLTIAGLLAEAVRRVNNEESISAMFR